VRRPIDQAIAFRVVTYGSGAIALGSAAFVFRALAGEHWMVVVVFAHDAEETWRAIGIDPASSLDADSDWCALSQKVSAKAGFVGPAIVVGHATRPTVVVLQGDDVRAEDVRRAELVLTRAVRVVRAVHLIAKRAARTALDNGI
jgi:hypothetical protein